jgi:hypothetical protein
MLGGIKDTSDNSALLDAVGTVFGVRGGQGGAGPGGAGGTAAGSCRAPGLYRLGQDAAGNFELIPLRLY